MRKPIASLITAAVLAAGILVAATPAQACTILTCPPVPDKQCGIAGQFCKPYVPRYTFPTRRFR